MYLVLFKLTKFNEIYNLTDKYCKKFGIDHYFLYCDETIDEDYLINNNVIKFKMKENNWETLLIKIIKTFNIFKNKGYEKIMVSNVSTFINFPILLKNIDINSKCSSCVGKYKFKNVDYNFPSGAGYVIDISIVHNICDFFYDNKYVVNNNLSYEFIENYPTTDDIFFGYYFHINNIEIDCLNRYDIIGNEPILPSNINDFSHIRVKTNSCETDVMNFKKMVFDTYQI